MAVKKGTDGIWYFAVRYKDPFGKTKQKKIRNKNWIKRDALNAERDFLLSVKDGVSTITFDELFKLYIDERSNKIKRKSIYNITMLVNKQISPIFGEMPIDKITLGHIQKWQNSLLNSEYSNRYTYKIQEQFKTVINFGLRYEYIDKNPFKIPIVQNRNEFKKEMLFWEQEEWNQFIQFVDNPVYFALFSTLYWTGIRIGEAQGLQIKDFDYENKEIHITKTYNPIHKELTTPKTQNSYRTVTITDNLTKLLEGLKQRYKVYVGYNDECFLFGFDEPLANNTIRRYFNNYIELANVKKIRIHDLRHSHVSLLRHHGFDRYEVAKRLGHTPAMVDNTYTHWFEKSQKEMRDKLNSLDKLV